MHTYTALYDTRAEAERVQAQLQSLGVIDADGNSLHDRTSAGLTDDRNSGRDFLANHAIADEDRGLYKEAVRRGGFLLTVNVDDDRSDEVRRLLDNSGAVDIDAREEEYRKAGVLGGAGAAAGGLAGAAAGAIDKVKDAVTPDTRDTNRQASFAQSGTRVEGEQAIPIVQEQLRVGKRAVERGGVRVRAYTVEQPVNEQVTLREEHVNIERRPVDQKLGAVDANLLQDRTIEMTETTEEAVVAKEARVVEEVIVNKQATEHTETIQDTVRHTEVDVERLPGSTTDRPLNR